MWAASKGLSYLTPTLQCYLRQICNCIVDLAQSKPDTNLPIPSPINQACTHLDKQQSTPQRQWQQQAREKQSNKRDRYMCERECGTSSSVAVTKMTENGWMKQQKWLPTQTPSIEHKNYPVIGIIDIPMYLPLSLSHTVDRVAVVHSVQQLMVLHKEYEHIPKVLTRPRQGQRAQSTSRQGRVRGPSATHVHKESR
jgi:hypothetical protein